MPLRPERPARAALGLALALAAIPGAGRAAPLAYDVQEGRNLNALLQAGETSAHLVLRGGERPRLLVAFPAGDSGAAVWFEPLAAPARWSITAPPRAITETDAAGRPLHGIVAEVSIAAPSLAVTRALATSIRVIRDVEGGQPTPAGVEIPPVRTANLRAWSRDRLDGAAGYRIALEATDGAWRGETLIAGPDGRIGLRLTALTGEAPLTPLASLLDDAAAPDAAARRTLGFLAYDQKLLAGSWRFDTYFGRDTLLSLALLRPALAPEAAQAALASVFARLSPQGEVAHEEDIGEFAVLDRRRAGEPASAAPVYDYKMVDETFLLAPVAAAWLLDDPRGRARATAFLAQGDGRVAGPARPRGADLVDNLRLVLQQAEPFARDPKPERLIALKPGFTVGDWRDSPTGLGGGRYAYDVNAILVPAAVAAADRLYRAGLLGPWLEAGDAERFARAGAVAAAWRERAPPLFEVRREAAEARAQEGAFAAEPGVTAASAPARPASFFALSLDAEGRPIPVMNSDYGFELLFEDPAPEEMARTLRGLLAPFPQGLMTGAGLLVANAAFAPAPLRAQFGPHAYHGAVVWSWQQALMLSGLQRQLRRIDLPAPVRQELIGDQARLWTAVCAQWSLRNSELWSWRWRQDRYEAVAFGAADADADESDAAQLWSTAYLALPPPGGCPGADQREVSSRDAGGTR